MNRKQIGLPQSLRTRFRLSPDGTGLSAARNFIRTHFWGHPMATPGTPHATDPSPTRPSSPQVLESAWADLV